MTNVLPRFVWNSVIIVRQYNREVVYEFLRFAANLTILSVNATNLQFASFYSVKYCDHVLFSETALCVVICARFTYLGASLLRPRERLRSIVMSASVCLFVREDISRTKRAIFTNFGGMLLMPMARSSRTLTIGRIAYRREGATRVHSAGVIALVILLCFFCLLLERNIQRNSARRTSQFQGHFQGYPIVFFLATDSIALLRSTEITRMWANAQRDGRPAEYRWRPLFNAAKFGWRLVL